MFPLLDWKLPLQWYSDVHSSGDSFVMASPNPTPSPNYSETPLQRVALYRDLIAAAGDQAQELRRLPDDCVDELIDAGFFRFTLPPELGGENATIRETIEVIEAIAAIDASVAWNVMIGSEINAMAAGGMDPDIAREVYVDNPRVIMCGGGGAVKPPRAEYQPDGSVKVWAQSNFMSGCHQCEYAFLMAPLMKGDEMDLDVTGQPVVKMWFLHRSQWEILDTWHMAGLRGSGSSDILCDGGVVRPEHFNVELVSPARYDNPVFRVPVPLRLSYNKAAVAIGVARGALDSFADLAKNKIPMLSATTLAQRPVAQQRMGEAEAAVRAARAFLMDTMKNVEEELEAGAEKPSENITMMARLACTHAANAAMTAVDSIHNAAGTTALRMDNPLERKLRDAKGCATHRWVSHPLYGEIGKIFLGCEPNPEFIGHDAPVGK